MASVTFRIGTSAQYSGLAVKDQYCFYYLQDTERLYLGTSEITSSAALAALAADVAQNTSDITSLRNTLTRLDGDASVSGSIRNLIAQAVEMLEVQLEGKVDASTAGINGTSEVANSGGGAGVKFTHSDGSISYIGTTDGGATGISGQIYTVKEDGDKFVGSRINMTKNGFYYLSNRNSSSYTSEDEIAVKGDLAPKQNKTLDNPLVIGGDTVTTVEDALSALNTAGSGDAASKTVYLVDASGVDPTVARKYNLYQGSDPLDMSNNTLVGTVNVPLDQVLRDAYIVTLIYSLGRLLDNGVDVTRLVKGDEPATLADAGKYMKFVMQNVTDPLYVAMSEFIDIISTDHQTSEITLNLDASNNLTGTIGTVAASKIIFEVAGGTNTTVQNEIEDMKSNMTWQSFA